MGLYFREHLSGQHERNGGNNPDAEVPDKPSAEQEADGCRCSPPRQSYRSQDRGPREDGPHVQDHARPHLLLRLPHTVWWWENHRLCPHLRHTRKRQTFRAQVQTSKAWHAGTEEVWQEAAQGEEEQDKEGPGHSQGQTGHWQEIGLHFG